ncbi:MAG TPA: hypothetical protein ENJ56_04085 [Anaerolineae bacterium]|nr:hypothetical protein [Anaerolineae bacterium]
MIVIEILNVEELAERESSQLAMFVGQIGRIDIEARVEKALIKQIKKSLQANGVEAKLSSIGGVKYSTYTKDKADKND